MNDQQEKEHWLVRPSTIRWLWQGFVIVLALTVLAQLLFPVKGYFRIDGIFGFGAAFGFSSCVLMVLFAKVLGLVVKRPENFYRDDRDA